MRRARGENLSGTDNTHGTIDQICHAIHRLKEGGRDNVFLNEYLILGEVADFEEDLNVFGPFTVS